MDVPVDVRPAPATSPLSLTPRGQWDTFADADAAQEAKRAADRAPDRAVAAQTRVEVAVQAQAHRERKNANDAWSVQDNRRTARPPGSLTLFVFI
jgi:hypothetical protein